VPSAEEWNPESEAIWQEKIPSGERAITLRHPGYPFVDERNEDPTPDDLTDIAAAYLRKVARLFGLPEDLLAAESDASMPPPGSAFRLTWLPIDMGDRPGPDASFWIRRFQGLPDNPVPIDRTAILLAVPAVVVNDAEQVLGSRLGIRIVAHVSTAGPPWIVRITGSTCSGDLARDIDLEFRAASASLTTFFADLFTDVGRTALKREIGAAAQLDPGLLWIDGVRIRRTPAGSPGVDLYMYAQRPENRPNALAYAVTARIAAHAGFAAQTVRKYPLFSHARVTARLFRRDPASEAGAFVKVRPNRAPPAFEDCRHRMVLPGIALISNEVSLVDDLDEVEVTQSRLVDAGADESHTQVVQRPNQIPHARTNAFAALSAYQHARELFDTMRAYGFQPESYFRFAALPLLVRYRAGIRPGAGKDGKTVNARVDYDPPARDLSTAWGTQVLRPLEVRFALADTKRSVSRRQPLGLASDPRWSWHEYCHVLIAASTGALELPFSHSAGDALAGILSDPGSQLTGRRRMATFPWVYLNRRHDRSVYDGWSWCGTHHRPARFPADSSLRLKGYQSEQILSTSLFRLYRALGGDAVDENGDPNPDARQAAADYAGYIIMRAIAWLGPISGAPIETPDQLVSALIDADIATSAATAGRLKRRVGGCAHKVVRWAFEAQGLYATTDPQAVVDAPGEPPDVDVFIDNGRPDSEGGHPRGGYMPVSLDWHALPDNHPLWHATGDALNVDGNQVSSVKVWNRGKSTANDVTVRVSYAKWPGAPNDPPAWNTTAWKPLALRGPQPVPPQQAVEFGPFPGLPGARPLLILAQATCPGDPANTDAATMLPCSTQSTPIVDLVAGDNNLGLRFCR
jgi:hypothetical protein